MYADIVVKNGKCVTFEGEEALTWIATEKENIAAMGSGDSYKALIDGSTIIVDAKGASILPGFIDSHFHVVQTGLNSMSLDLSQTRSFDDIGWLISEAKKKTPGKPIRGIRLELENLLEKKMPTRNFLDRFCNDAPVWINTNDYQMSLLNTYAMLYFKIPFTTEGVEMDSNDMPTGVFTKKANAILRTNILKNIPNSERMEAVGGIMEEILSNGITTVNAMEGGFLYSDKDAEFIHEHAMEFPVDMVLFNQTMDMKKIDGMKLKRVGGSLYIDGTIGARAAALSFEYVDCPGTMGGLCLPQEEIDAFVLNCYQKNLQLALYTIGDRAIEVALQAHEKAIFQTGNTNLRHRLEHAELINDDQLERARQMGIILSMQPAYEYFWGGPDKMYFQRMGERYKTTNRFRKILNEGICICGGTDSDVTPIDPMLGIYSAVNHPVEEHRISLKEAIKIFTYNGAYGIFEEDKKGSLKVGKLADIIVLDCNIFQIQKEKLKDVKVMTTIKSGEILHNNM